MKVRCLGSRVLFQRHGSLNFVDQRRGTMGERAPERHGLWAFPWPHHDFFYSWHKWQEVLPKHLNDDAFRALMHGYRDADREEQAALGEKLAELREEAVEWKRQHRSILPLHEFWYEGELYAHFDPRGEPTAVDVWYLMTAKRLAEIVEAQHKLWDHGLEVFIPRGRGRIS